MISPAFPYTKRQVTVHGQKMAYVDAGEGDPIVLLHGNPTSSYLWRNVIPYLQPLGRCVAPDLVGMGDSDKLPGSGPGSYMFVEHRHYLDGLLAALGIHERVTLVLHDWGSALGFDWANRNRDRVRGIVYMEAIVRPLTWDDWREPSRSFFQALRSPDGEAMVLERNLFVERLLPGGVLRPLGEEEMTEYRRPYVNAGEDRRPVLTWPRQIPIEGRPGDVNEVVGDYAAWLRESRLPKLFVNGEPGALLTRSQRDFCRTWPLQQEVTVHGIHFLQEDAPDEIGRAIAHWLLSIGAGGGV